MIASAPIKPPGKFTCSHLPLGGLDDGNAPDLSAAQLYHSSFGEIAEGLQKPELIAPAIWIAAPLLPGKAQQATAALPGTFCSPRRRPAAFQTCPMFTSRQTDLSTISMLMALHSRLPVTVPSSRSY